MDDKLQSISKQFDTLLCQVEANDNSGCPEFYEAVQQQIKKLILPIPETVDWDIVYSASYHNLLKCKSDLNVAHYLVVSVVEIHGLEGLLIGTNFIERYVEKMWLVMRPKYNKKKSRERSVDWFFSRILTYLRNKNSEVVGIKLAEESVSMLKSYTESLSRLSACHYRVPSELVSQLESMYSLHTNATYGLDESKAVAHESGNHYKLKNKVNVSKENLALGESLLTSVRVVNESEDETILLRNCQQQLAALSRRKFRLDPFDVLAYAYRRTAAWLSMQLVPKHNSDGLSQLQAPTISDKKALMLAEQKGDSMNIVIESEKLLDRHPLWLDANMITINALRDMGLDNLDIETAIFSLLNDFLNRFDQLRKLSFSNREPMFGKLCCVADELSVQHKKHAQSIILSSSNVDTLGERIDNDLTLAKSNITIDNKDLQAMQQQIKDSNCKRNTCKLQIDLIGYCLSTNKIDLALTRIQSTWSQVATIRFNTWETDMTMTLSQYHISAILSKQRHGVEMQRVDKALCCHMYRYISAINVCAANEIDTSTFM